jgi:hypothetical protein
MVERRGWKVESKLRPHDASFDFRLPDHVAGLQRLNADLALLRSAVLADPCNSVAGAAVLALEPDRLSHALDARRHYQARSGGGNFIGAAILRFDTSNVWKHLYGHSKMQPLFMALFRGIYYGRCACRRR